MNKPHSHTTIDLPTGADEVVRIALLTQAEENAEIIILLSGYYMGARSFAPAAESLFQAGYTVAIIEPYGGPNWIDPLIRFDRNTPPIIRSWTSAAVVALDYLQEHFPAQTVHLVGYSLGGPSSLLAAQHTEVLYVTHTLLAPIGVHAPIERGALKLAHTALTRPLGFLIGRMTIVLQIFKNTLQFLTPFKTTQTRKAHRLIMSDRPYKHFEGAGKISYPVAVAKLTFSIEKYLIERKNSTRLAFLAFTNDAFVSLPPIKRMAENHDIPCFIVPGTHITPISHPEQVAPLIVTHIQDKS